MNEPDLSRMFQEFLTEARTTQGITRDLATPEGTVVFVLTTMSEAEQRMYVRVRREDGFLDERDRFWLIRQFHLFGMPEYPIVGPSWMDIRVAPAQV